MSRLRYLLELALILAAFIAGCNWKECPEQGQETAAAPTVQVDSGRTETHINAPVPTATRPSTRRNHNLHAVGNQIHNQVEEQPQTIVEEQIQTPPEPCDSVRDYTLYSQDSLTKVKLTVEGWVVDATIENTSITRTITQPSPPPRKWAAYAGVNLAFNSVTLQGTIVRPKSYMGAGWDIINHQPQIHYGIQLFHR